jgi:hypothetical protein
MFLGLGGLWVPKTAKSEITDKGMGITVCSFVQWSVKESIFLSLYQYQLLIIFIHTVGKIWHLLFVICISLVMSEV